MRRLEPRRYNLPVVFVDGADDFGVGEERFAESLRTPRAGVPDKGALDGMPLAGIGEVVAEGSVLVTPQ